MKRVLITGGFGFVGSHLVEALHAQSDAAIHVVDNLSTSPLPLPFLLDSLGAMPRLSFDIRHLQEFCAGERHAHFDQIYHLASVVGPAGVIPHMGSIVKSIVDDTYAVMELASRTGAKLVDVSTSEVYGGGQEGYCSETLAKIIPPKTSARLEYAIGKLAGETALINRTRVSPLNACIVRPFNISGPRQSGKGGFVLPRFVSAALKDEDISIFGDGRQVRAFTHVKDVVSGIILTMENGRTGEAYNVGNPANKCTIEELADETIRAAGSRSRKLFVDPKRLYGSLYEEANDKYPDADKAMTELGWRPFYDRASVIKDTVSYFRSLPDDVFALLSGSTSVPAAGPDRKARPREA